MRRRIVSSGEHENGRAGLPSLALGRRRRWATAGTNRGDSASQAPMKRPHSDVSKHPAEENQRPTPQSSDVFNAICKQQSFADASANELNWTRSGPLCHVARAARHCRRNFGRSCQSWLCRDGAALPPGDLRRDQGLRRQGLRPRPGRRAETNTLLSLGKLGEHCRESGLAGEYLWRPGESYSDVILQLAKTARKRLTLDA